jgi:hypothetical protein
MVNAEQKRRMTELVLGSLEESGLYNIVENDGFHILVAERPELKENPRTIDVLIHNYHRPVHQFLSEVGDNRAQGVDTANIFYKDGQEFMVRLGVRGRNKYSKSLKNYSGEQINAMIHLRDLEKVVLEGSGRKLTYYQPETERLGESIRTFEMGDVTLDYSHIGPANPSYEFVQNRISRDFKQAVQIGAVTGPIELSVTNGYVGMNPMRLVKPTQLKLRI